MSSSSSASFLRDIPPTTAGGVYVRARGAEDDDDDDIDENNGVDYGEDLAPKQGGGCLGWFGRLPAWGRVTVIVLSIGAVVGLFLGLLLGDGPGQGQPAPKYRQRPVVVSTWFFNATSTAWLYLNHSFPALDAVENGCMTCEEERCDGTVGWGGSPDTTGETTLDALIMDGTSHDVGAVGYLRRVKNAISTARKVMHYTGHTILAGDGATNFSVLMGEAEEDLHSQESIQIFADWKNASCQPNYWTNVVGNNSCGPWTPVPTPAPTPYPPSALAAAVPAGQRIGGAGSPALPAAVDGKGQWVHHPALLAPRAMGTGHRSSRRRPVPASTKDHDTVGMCALDVAGNFAVGVSSNGANHKVAGRIGDAPIVGGGGYASTEAGCSAATGDGDITMRFLPAYQAVENMRKGMSPADACADAVKRIEKYFPVFDLGLVCVNPDGEWGAAAHGTWTFTYCAAAPSTNGEVVCTKAPQVTGLLDA
jgi:N4-(beta-N-acetylglucosaminyl)-L-asparaginase